MVGRLLRWTIFYRRYKELRWLYAAYLYADPSYDMTVIGVTGTDGKTTTCTLIAHLLQHLGKNVIMVGTNGVTINGVDVVGISKMTSYDPMDLQKYLAMGREAGCTYAVLEVSSHALDQWRFKKVKFSVALLTNITAEHLDYHRTMESYAAAKQKLFRQIQESGKEALAVLPMDDLYGRQRAERMRFGRMLSFGFNPNASVKANAVMSHPTVTDLTVECRGVEYKTTIPLLGKFNVLNVLWALAVLSGLGFEMEGVLAWLSSYKQALGRQEHYELWGVHRYIDFAHTPKGLEVMLEFLESVSGTGRVICLFGAPGRRDPFKRPLMGNVVQSLADVIIVTDDDASTENRRHILRDIMKWITKQEWDNYYVIPDRRQAIAFATQIAKPGDVVLLAGKGHETVLVTNFWKKPRNEKEVLMEERKKTHPETV